MRTSNIIILSVLSSLLIMTAIIPALYGIEYNEKLSFATAGYSRLNFESRKVIVLDHVNDAVIVPFDSLVIEVDDSNFSMYDINEKNDTVVVRPKSITDDAPVMLFVPQNGRVVATDSRVLIKGDYRRIDPPSYSITLQNSFLYSRSIAKDPKVGQSLGHLTLTDKGSSTVELKGRFDIDHLTLNDVRVFNCTPDVGIRNSDFSFDKSRAVTASTCREGVFITSR